MCHRIVIHADLSIAILFRLAQKPAKEVPLTRVLANPRQRWQCGEICGINHNFLSVTLNTRAFILTYNGHEIATNDSYNIIYSLRVLKAEGLTRIQAGVK